VTILDTNVLSELMKQSPADAVSRWMLAQPGQELYTTSISQAEILYGVELLPRGKRRGSLELAARRMFDKVFAGRVLIFDSAAAEEYSRIAAGRRLQGRPITHADAQIAAIARAHGATLATRDAADFDGCGITVVNPWIAA